jgi:hypothetical protein
VDELNHRIKNELASVINLISFNAIWTDNVEAKEELSNVVDLLHQHVEVHSLLTMPDRAGLRGLDRGHANFRGVEARAANYSANSYIRNSYASDGYGQGYRYGRYAAAAAYAYPTPATTSPPIGDTAKGGFLSVMETD